MSGWTIVTAAEKQQVPLRSSPSSAKLLIISVNEQTRPGSVVTRRATIPWRNALFIIYQKQSTGHFPLYFVHSSSSPVRREAFFPGLRPILILRRAFRTCFSEDRKEGRIIDCKGLSLPISSSINFDARRRISLEVWLRSEEILCYRWTIDFCVSTLRVSSARMHDESDIWYILFRIFGIYRK